MSTNDNMIDVWRVTMNGSSCYFDNHQAATETAQMEAFEEGETAVVTPEKMHREIFENLPEFNGF